MKISFDKTIDALYIEFVDAKSVKTIEVGDALVDFDKESNVIGVEVLNFLNKCSNGKIEIDVNATGRLFSPKTEQ
jgi:uncharacterized protein YuzE